VLDAILSIIDLDISTLATVLDPFELGNYLCSVLPVNWGLLRDLKVKVLKHHRGKRCTVDITLQTTTGKHSLIGKVYAKDRSDIYRAMKEISQSGFAAEAEFSVPKPIAFIPELQLLLMEKVQGPLASEIFLTGDESEQTKAAERCACWLAQFHACAPMLGPRLCKVYPLNSYPQSVSLSC
jgi:hypothetical protein